MKFRTLLAATVLATSLLASPTVYAATVHTPIHAMFSKTKTIKITIIDDTGAPMEVKAGDEIIKLDAGKPVTVNLAVGTRIVTSTATASQQSGTLIAEVTSQLSGATIHIK
ncbi:MAG TPA: hypothetical protein VGB69_02040 [Edaphobacter sp.]